jgi:hypothetical protein
MKYNMRSRRMFLQGAGATLSIPFLQSLLPREAWGQAAVPAKRFVAVKATFDIGHISHFFPSLDKPSQVLNSGIPFHPPIHYAPLSSYLTGGKTRLSRMIGPEFNPYLGSMNVIRGLDLGIASHRQTIGHNMSTILGVLNGPANEASLYADLPKIRTIDQVLNDFIGFNPFKRPSYFWAFRGGGIIFKRDSSGAIVSQGPTTTRVGDAYNSVFNSGAYPESGETIQSHPRRDLLSRVLEDYTRVSKGRQISSLDKVVLDNALDKISDLQKSLGPAQVTAGCFHKHINKTTQSTGNYMTGAQTLKNFADLITATLMCDLSRSIVFGTGIGSDSSYNKTTDGSGFHQGHSHGAYNVVNGKVNHEHMADVHGEFIKYFIAPLIQNLSAATDAATGKSLLHSMIVHYGTEHSMTHTFTSRPTMMFGNAGGAITTGHYLDYVNYAGIAPGQLMPSNDITASHLHRGTFYNRLLVSYLQGLGMSPADYENPSFNTSLVGLTNPKYGAHNLGITNVGGYGHIAKSKFDGGGAETSNIAARYYTHYKHPLFMPPTSST